MALTYADSAALMQDGAFINRVKIACLKYADYIMNEAITVPAHSARLRWAQNTASNPAGVATHITPVVVMDGQVQSAGAEITDENLQMAVEASVNKFL